MTLYCETSGRGADVVLLHGWGLNSAVWQDTVRELAWDFRVTTVDLPGHGRSHAAPERCTLEQVAERVLQHAPPQAHWIGWSLGGTVALYITAHYPQRVRKLALVASTPKFVNAQDWPHGIEPEVLGQFAQQLHGDYRKTIQRFLALQLRGSEQASVWLRRLRDMVFRYGEPQATALHAGLDILRNTDLRPRLTSVGHPILLIAGARDTLAPVSAHEYMAVNLAQAELQVIPGAAHAPFLTHPQEFQRALRTFLHE
ncbi:MAG: pimeloyl-ACP methyl ester esterase BioH [Gammaproteobacteria bacterium]